MRSSILIFGIMLLLFSQSAFAPSAEFYAPLASVGGNWSNNPGYATLAPDDSIAWDLLDSNSALYTYGFSLIGFTTGQINGISLGLRSNFSSPFSGDDRLTLKYSLDSINWKNLDGTVFDGSNASNQSLALRTEYYLLPISLSWADLIGIYLGVESKTLGGPDSEITGIDAIWLKIDYSDIEPPLVSLMRPADNNLSLNKDIVFSYNVSDTLSNISNCSLIINGAPNATNSSVSKGIEQYFRVFSLPDGYFNWSVNCTDNSSNYNTNKSVTRALTIDTLGPAVMLESPSNSFEWNTTPDVSFRYNVSDSVGNISYCYLVVDGQINGSIDYSITEDATQNFNSQIGNGDHNWSVNCTDSSGIQSNSTTYNLGVDVHYPNVTGLGIADPVNLAVGSIVELQCNASVTHSKGIGMIANVDAILYDSDYSSTSPDNKNNHYTNSSCRQISASGTTANYTCSFWVYYYANPDAWRCNISATDINGLVGSEEKNFTINTLYGISITPSYINFSSLHVGQNSTGDVNLTITNQGNIEIDLGLYGYAQAVGDGLSMNCTNGAIPIGNERYAITGDMQYNSMTPLTIRIIQIDSFNLEKQTLEAANASRRVYWKIGVPFGVGGSCSGNVVIGAVPS